MDSRGPDGWITPPRSCLEKPYAQSSLEIHAERAPGMAQCPGLKQCYAVSSGHRDQLPTCQSAAGGQAGHRKRVEADWAGQGSCAYLVLQPWALVEEMAAGLKTLQDREQYDVDVWLSDGLPYISYL